MRGDKTRAKILALEGVEDVWNEGADGWWISTKPGYRMSDNTVHSWSGPTLTELLRDARGIVKCDLDCECNHGMDRERYTK